ncbi:hypothetical protein DW886_28585 [Enterocloster aldenensis]|uniref:mannonate dehydratase n=1 Tax=Enterocloster aldenensis TaxID=358742 RepID=UPI000E481543|nr:hypothetical protein DW886_28585 [Enterocloster aldenensis]
MHSKMRVVLGQFQTFDDEMAKFALQLGISEIQMNTPALPGGKVWSFEALKNLKEKMEGYGLKWTAIENVPLIFYDKVILGLPGRDEQIENYCETIRNMGRLGISILGHHFSPTFVWRTTTEATGRGGARATAFDEEQLAPGSNAFREMMARKRHLLDYDVFEAANGITADILFNNYRYFMDAVVPEAEKAGVMLALHPDDPPLRKFGRIERMITGLEDYKRAMEIAHSPVWGVNLCLGCCSEKGGRDCAIETIRYLGARKKIFSVHFRDVKGTLPCFEECFLGEGNFNPAEILYELGQVGYDGIIMEDHVLKMDYDSAYGHRARGHEIGYIQGMLKMMDFVAG